MQSENIVGTVEALKGQGVIFLDTPDSYYEEVEGRVGEIAENYGDLHRLRILADRDGEDGYLLDLHEDGPGPADGVLRGDRATRRDDVR